MYHEEKIINGVLMYRSSPYGKWAKISIKTLTLRHELMKKALKDIANIENDKDNKEIKKIANDALNMF